MKGDYTGGMEQSAKPHVVSVDDEVNVLKLIRAVLEPTYRVTTFSDSRQALEGLGDLEPDLIICDITMPGLDGYGLHASVRSLPGLRGVPFIYLTALDTRRDFREGMQRGADDYLTKPFTAAELQEAVAARLVRSSALRTDTNTDLSIHSLGGVGLYMNESAVQYEAKKVVALLLYLLANEQARFSTLRRALWQEEVSDNTLRVLINRTRKALGELAEVAVKGDTVSLILHGTYVWDAEVFEAAARQALTTRSYVGLEQAVALHDTFLPGFDSPWVERQRASYDALYLDLLGASAEVAPNEASVKAAQVRLNSFLSGS